MIYVLALCDGYKSSHQLDNLIGDNKFQPIEFEDDVEDCHIEELKTFLYMTRTDDDMVYMFVDYTSPIQHRNVFDAMRGIANIIVAREI